MHSNNRFPAGWVRVANMRIPHLGQKGRTGYFDIGGDTSSFMQRIPVMVRPVGSHADQGSCADVISIAAASEASQMCNEFSQGNSFWRLEAEAMERADWRYLSFGTRRPSLFSLLVECPDVSWSSASRPALWASSWSANDSFEAVTR